MGKPIVKPSVNKIKDNSQIAEKMMSLKNGGKSGFASESTSFTPKVINKKTIDSLAKAQLPKLSKAEENKRFGTITATKPKTHDEKLAEGMSQIGHGVKEYAEDSGKDILNYIPQTKPFVKDGKLHYKSLAGIENHLDKTDAALMVGATGLGLIAPETRIAKRTLMGAKIAVPILSGINEMRKSDDEELEPISTVTEPEDKSLRAKNSKTTAPSVTETAKVAKVLKDAPKVTKPKLGKVADVVEDVVGDVAKAIPKKPSKIIKYGKYSAIAASTMALLGAAYNAYNNNKQFGKNKENADKARADFIKQNGKRSTGQGDSWLKEQETKKNNVQW